MAVWQGIFEDVYRLAAYYALTRMTIPSVVITMNEQEVHSLVMQCIVITLLSLLLL